MRHQLNIAVTLLCGLLVTCDELRQQTLTRGQPLSASPSDCMVVMLNHFPADTPAGRLTNRSARLRDQASRDMVSISLRRDGGDYKSLRLTLSHLMIFTSVQH